MTRDWKWNIRPANGDDLNFIYATWLQSFWADNESSRGSAGPTFFNEYPKVVDHILAQSKTVVACKFDDPLVIYGYLVASPPIAHYTFVKSNFRRYGIAKALLEHLKCGETYTHRTGILQNILSTHPGRTYNPYLLYTQGEKHVESPS